jgi:hypothetical protein
MPACASPECWHIDPPTEAPLITIEPVGLATVEGPALALLDPKHPDRGWLCENGKGLRRLVVAVEDDLLRYMAIKEGDVPSSMITCRGKEVGLGTWKRWLRQGDEGARVIAVIAG